MLKVFIVEDEFIVREGIKNRIDWKANGFEFAGEAADGEVGFSMIQRVRPDIVVTDIKMPFMDGLEMSKKVKEILPDTEIIILTGYADFNYAREGLKVGVAEYLTKPIKPEELLTSLKNLAEKINERILENEARERHMMEREQELVKFYSDASNNVAAGIEDELNMHEIDLKQVDRDRLEEFLKLGGPDESDEFVDDLFAAIDPAVMRSMLFRQYLIMDAYFAVCDFVEGLNGDRTAIEAPDMASGVFINRENAILYMKRIVSAALGVREEASGSKYQDLVSEMKGYVEANYADSELSLNSVAEHIGFSPNHLSMVFSQQTGSTFIKYLTDYRINKAKELLKCTSMRNSEISEAVGYSDPHYFSYIFKKNQGVTPSQYRGK